MWEIALVFVCALLAFLLFYPVRVIVSFACSVEKLSVSIRWLKFARKFERRFWKKKKRGKDEGEKKKEETVLHSNKKEKSDEKFSEKSVPAGAPENPSGESLKETSKNAAENFESETFENPACAPENPADSSEKSADKNLKTSALANEKRRLAPFAEARLYHRNETIEARATWKPDSEYLKEQNSSPRDFESSTSNDFEKSESLKTQSRDSDDSSPREFEYSTSDEFKQSQSRDFESSTSNDFEKSESLKTQPRNSDDSSLREFENSTSDEFNQSQSRDFESSTSNDFESSIFDDFESSTSGDLKKQKKSLNSETLDEPKEFSDADFFRLLLQPKIDSLVIKVLKKLTKQSFRLFRVKFENCVVEGLSFGSPAKTGYWAIVGNNLPFIFPELSGWSFNFDFCGKASPRSHGTCIFSVNLIRMVAFIFFAAYVSLRLVGYYFLMKRRYKKAPEEFQLSWWREKIVQFLAEDA